MTQEQVQDCRPPVRLSSFKFDITTKFANLHVKVVRDVAQTGVSVSWNVSGVPKAGVHGHSWCIHVCTIGARQMTELARKHTENNLEAFFYF